MHLTGPLAYLALTVMALLLYPAIYVNFQALFSGADAASASVSNNTGGAVAVDAASSAAALGGSAAGGASIAMLIGLLFFALGTLSAAAYFVASQRAQGRGWASSIAFVPALIFVGIGVALNSSRGVLEALGIDFDLGPNDVAIRGNFCTLDEAGNISDRRAGRVGNDIAAPLCEKLDKIEIPGVEVFVQHVKEYRLVVVFRGEGLGGNIDDTDPQKTGVPPLDPVGHDDASHKTVEIANQFLAQAREVLKDDAPANFLTLRGIAKRPPIPTFEEVYGTKPAAIAVYPMYRGLARLVGMDIVGPSQTLDDQMDWLKKVWDDYDFFFIHFKYTDSTGEDGNFDAKVQRTEEVDTCIPKIMGLDPSVLIVTGDHSTPSKMRSHSWHPVPTLLAAQNCRFDGADGFGESQCKSGSLGQFEAKHLMLLALAHAGRLEKFGA